MPRPLKRAIRKRAYAIFEKEGCPDGRDQDHWLRAESEIISGSLASNPRTSYENFAVDCPWCHKESNFNRRSDLHTCDSIIGLSVACLKAECGKLFRIGNDSANTAHEMLIFDVQELYERKHYMNCILNLVQAYEVFFSWYLRVEILLKPFSSDPERDPDKLTKLEEELYNKVKTYTFDNMRALFLQHIVTGSSPRNLKEAEAKLSDFPKPQIPSDAAIKAITDTKLIPLLEVVKNTKIHAMRNLVVHKRAYRPTREGSIRRVRRQRILCPH
jgi:hypothetical protein